MSDKVIPEPTNEVTLVGADLDLLATTLFVPLKVFLCIAIAILIDTGVHLWPESANSFEVLLVEFLRALEDTQSTVIGAIG